MSKAEIVKKSTIDYVNFKSKKVSTEDIVLRKLAEESRANRRKANQDKDRKGTGVKQFKATLIQGRWIQIDGIVRQCNTTGVISYLHAKSNEWVLVDDIEDLPLSRYNALMNYRNSKSESQFGMMEVASIKGDISKYIREDN